MSRNTAVMSAFDDQPRAASSAHRAILLVDDDPAVRDFVSFLLELEGFRVTAVAGGLACLAALRAAPTAFGLVLLDRMMPDLSGDSVLFELRASPSLAQIPVVMVSAHAEGLATTPDAFLRKPFRPDELVALVHRHHL